MRESRRNRASAWLWGLVACNGIAATATHVALAGLWQPSLVGAFQICAMLAHFTVLAALLAVPPWVLLRLGARRAIATSLATLVFGGLLVVVLVNAKVYLLYKFHLNTMVWYLMIQGAAIQTLAFSSQMWGALIAITVGIFAAQAGACWALQQWTIDARLLGRYAALILLLGIGTQLIHAYADATADDEILIAVRGIPWAQPLTAKAFLSRSGFDIRRTEPENDPARNPTAGVFNYPLEKMQCSGGSKPNVLMIVIDSLRFDMLTPGVMPRTASWAQDSTRFEHHYSTGNGTRFGIFGLMYGLPGGYWHAALAERRGPVLIDVLDDLDYQFFVFGSAPLDSPEFHRTVFTRVWDRVARPGPGDVVERDRTTTRDLITAMHERDATRPFFGFLFLDAPHAYAYPRDISSPFSPRLASINYLELDNDFDPAPFLNLYKTSVLFDDGLVGDVLQAVADDPSASNTIVLVTGDHGQAFNETHDNSWGHNSAFSDYQVRVPFVLRWPGRPAGAISRLTSHMDWAPTLLTDALRCDVPIDRYSTGASLFAPNETNRALPIEQWTQRAVRTNERVYVFLSWGGHEVRDAGYASIDEPVNRLAVEAGFEQLSHFTRR